MKEKTRPAVLAGSWYPGNPNDLTKTIQHYVNQVKSSKIKNPIRGLISPHAGYVYSGQVAAHSFKQIENQAYDVVVVLAPLHRMPVGRYVVNRADAYETPLGRVSLQRDIIRQLSEKVDLTFVDHEEEHAIEIQLPFLQTVLPELNVLPIMVGFAEMNQCDDLIKGLTQILKDFKSLIVISTDLHHISNYNEVVAKDKEVIQALESYKMPRIRERLNQADCSVCGRVPLTIGLSVLKNLGAKNLQILYHTNSGDVTGERLAGQYTVGYLAAAVI